MNLSSFSKFSHAPIRLVFRDTSENGMFTAFVFEVNITSINSIHSPGKKLFSFIIGNSFQLVILFHLLIY